MRSMFSTHFKNKKRTTCGAFWVFRSCALVTLSGHAGFLYRRKYTDGKHK